MTKDIRGCGVWRVGHDLLPVRLPSGKTVSSTVVATPDHTFTGVA
jgi:hypothetical protein